MRVVTSKAGVRVAVCLLTVPCIALRRGTCLHLWHVSTEQHTKPLLAAAASPSHCKGVSQGPRHAPLHCQVLPTDSTSSSPSSTSLLHTLSYCLEQGIDSSQLCATLI